MILEYIVTERVFGFNQSKAEKYVARSVDSGQVRFNEMYTKVSRLCSVHRRVVDLVVSGLVDMMIEDIDDGRTMQMREFGLFRPTIKMRSANAVEEVNAGNILSKYIVFTPGEIFHRTLEEMSTTRSVPVDTDYADGGGNSGNTGGTDGPNEGGEEENPPE